MTNIYFVIINRNGRQWFQLQTASWCHVSNGDTCHQLQQLEIQREWDRMSHRQGSQAVLPRYLTTWNWVIENTKVKSFPLIELKLYHNYFHTFYLLLRVYLDIIFKGCTYSYAPVQIYFLLYKVNVYFVISYQYYWEGQWTYLTRFRGWFISSFVLHFSVHRVVSHR